MSIVSDGTELFLTAKLSENRLNVKVSSLGELRSVNRYLENVQPGRCEDYEAIGSGGCIFERTELGLRLQFRTVHCAHKLSPLIEPEKRCVRDDNNPITHKTESTCFRETVISNRTQIVPEIIELNKTIWFEHKYMVVRTNEDLVRRAKPRPLIIDVAKGSLVADITGKLHYTKIIPVENKEIAQA
jgi:hypothetical protein